MHEILLGLSRRASSKRAVYAGFILDIRGGDPAYASLHTAILGWKDTINVPRFGSVDILVPVRDFTGSAVYHCHIVEHEDTGMMGIWEIA